MSDRRWPVRGQSNRRTGMVAQRARAVSGRVIGRDWSHGTRDNVVGADAQLRPSATRRSGWPATRRDRAEFDSVLALCVRHGAGNSHHSDERRRGGSGQPGRPTVNGWHSRRSLLDERHSIGSCPMAVDRQRCWRTPRLYHRRGYRPDEGSRCWTRARYDSLSSARTARRRFSLPLRLRRPQVRRSSLRTAAGSRIRPQTPADGKSTCNRSLDLAHGAGLDARRLEPRMESERQRVVLLGPWLWRFNLGPDDGRRGA